MISTPGYHYSTRATRYIILARSVSFFQEVHPASYLRFSSADWMWPLFSPWRGTRIDLSTVQSSMRCVFVTPAFETWLRLEHWSMLSFLPRRSHLSNAQLSFSLKAWNSISSFVGFSVLNSGGAPGCGVNCVRIKRCICAGWRWLGLPTMNMNAEVGS